jgi:hypothetical protein
LNIYFGSLGSDVTGAFASGGVDDQSNVVSEEDELQRAIQMSLQALEKKEEEVQVKRGTFSPETGLLNLYYQGFFRPKKFNPLLISSK